MLKPNLFVCGNCVLITLCGDIDYTAQDYEWSGSWRSEYNDVTAKCIPSRHATTQRVKEPQLPPQRTMDSMEIKWKRHWESLPLSVLVCMSVMLSLVWVSGRCMSDTGAHVTLLVEPSSSWLSFFT